ncbi:hypothetical protein AC579_7172 [Pseudocercospora musae]|uniref:Uncharacterized protein n=1 Tax=Pseudocercospora musae TaxID=113226 RepID=A0A139I8C3_9PEZI|nr:hypothetical protein AC579_7172 [Pseudocercospora musae]
MVFTQKGGAVASWDLQSENNITMHSHPSGSQPAGRARLSRNALVAARRSQACRLSNGSGPVFNAALQPINRTGLLAPPTPDFAIFDDTHSRSYFRLQSGVEHVIYYSRAEHIEAQGAAPRVPSPVTANSHGQTYDNLPTNPNRSYTTSPTGEKICHSQAEYTGAQAQRVAPRVPPPVTVNTHGQTYSNLPTVSSDLPPWSIYESKRKLYNFDTHRQCMNRIHQEPLDSGYDADIEDNTPTNHPPWYTSELSRQNYNLHTHVQYSRIFEAEKCLLKIQEFLRNVREEASHRFITPEQEQVVDSEETSSTTTEFEEEDSREQLQRYQSFAHSDASSYSPLRDSDFSAASEMLSMTSDSGSVSSKDESVETDGGEETYGSAEVQESSE